MCESSTYRKNTRKENYIESFYARIHKSVIQREITPTLFTCKILQKNLPVFVLEWSE